VQHILAIENMVFDVSTVPVTASMPGEKISHIWSYYKKLDNCNARKLSVIFLWRLAKRHISGQSDVEQ